MTDPEDPSRLLDSPSAPRGLRESLRAAAADVGSDQQIARLAERLGPLLGPAVPPTAVASTAAATGAGAKVALAALALIVAGGGAWLLSAPQSASPPAPLHSAAAPPAAPAAAPAPPSAAAAPALPVAPAAPPESAAPSDPAPAAPQPSPAALEAKPRKPTPPAPLSEADLLERARASLGSNPARALRLANQVRASFPHGVLVQEREVIAIEALRRLGRNAEADQRSAAFAKAFPGSAFARKLDASP